MRFNYTKNAKIKRKRHKPKNDKRDCLGMSEPKNQNPAKIKTAL